MNFRVEETKLEGKITDMCKRYKVLQFLLTIPTVFQFVQITIEDEKQKKHVFKIPSEYGELSFILEELLKIYNTGQGLFFSGEVRTEYSRNRIRSFFRLPQVISNEYSGLILSDDNTYRIKYYETINSSLIIDRDYANLEAEIERVKIITEVELQ